MGFTPAFGLVLATRCGHIDPVRVTFLARVEGMSPERFQRMVNQESGLLGVSETGADLRYLLGRREVDVRAAEETMIATEAIRLSVPSPQATMSFESTTVNP